jgi:2-haloacid dehalogenase
MMLKFDDFEVVTFDCYGTLIDWESGLLKALSPILATRGIDIANETLLELYGALETAEESSAYIIYKDVLKNVLRKMGSQLGFTPAQNELESFSLSVKDWLPFPDTVPALQKLKKRFKLAIISNIDDDLFAASARRLKVDFDWVITAQQVKSYKPSVNNFHSALAIIALPENKILHAAQSLYHDVAPAKSLGLSTVWIHRRVGKEGFGATPQSDATPDLTFADLQSFADAALREGYI